MTPPDSPIDSVPLPTPATPLIGRASDVARLHVQLARSDVRLVTLTGPPGVGKTRLALEVARGVQQHGPAGVWWVDFASVTNPAQVSTTIAQALGIALAAPAGVVTTNATVFPADSLLVLDNFEQVLPAATDVAALLHAYPTLTILVTSRAPLNLRWEHTVLLAPLPVPDRVVPDVAQLATVPAIALFVQRAQARDPHFALTDANAAMVIAICRALDGLPLALELAAAQVGRLALPTMLTMLQRRLPLPAWGIYDLPPRQQTLHTAIQWSEDLLPEATRALFRRFAVFVGGWTINAASAVVGSGGDDAEVVTALATLVDASLVTLRAGDEPRWGLLQPIRDYAATHLASNPAWVPTEQQHTAYFLALAEHAHTAALTPERLADRSLLHRLAREQDNVLAAFERSVQQRGAVNTAVQFAAALAPVWMLHGQLHRGRTWMERVVQQAHALTSSVVLVRSWAATFAYHQGDVQAAHRHHAQCLLDSEHLGDHQQRAAALLGLALLADARGDDDDAWRLNEQALAVYDALGDRSGRAWVLTNQGHLEAARRAYEQAEALLHESLALFIDLDDLRGQAWAHIGLGHVAFDHPDRASAAHHYAASLALFDTLGDVRGRAWATTNQGRVAQATGDAERAMALHQESLATYRGVGDRRGIARTLLHLGQALITQEALADAEPVLREALALFEQMGDVPNAARTRAAQRQLARSSSPDASLLPRLTPREAEILRLVAEGLSNRAIAERLVITTGTVNVHLAAIYRKFGVTSRTAAVHNARGAGLL